MVLSKNAFCDVLGKFGPTHGRPFVIPILLFLRITEYRSGHHVFGPCFFSPCICKQKLSFCCIASHAQTVSKEGQVSSWRQILLDFGHVHFGCVTCAVLAAGPVLAVGGRKSTPTHPTTPDPAQSKNAFRDVITRLTSFWVDFRQVWTKSWSTISDPFLPSLYVLQSTVAETPFSARAFSRHVFVCQNSRFAALLATPKRFLIRG